MVSYTRSWKGPTGIIESSSWPCAGQPQESHQEPENPVQTLLEHLIFHVRFLLTVVKCSDLMAMFLAEALL